MFDGLSKRLGDVFDRLKRRGRLTEADVSEAMREVRVALLEADVALPVVKDFVATVRERAVGQEVIRSVTPGQMVVKIVHDALVDTLGGEEAVGGVDLHATAPVPILMVGLQGSGKTTTSAKIGRRLQRTQGRKVLLASLDVQRPAAQEQLAVLGRQAEVATLPIVPGQKPVDIARRSMDVARKEGFDVVILDTAGRLHVDEALMAEVAAVRDVAKPHETLLVADAMTGQDAVTVARSFNERVGLTGIVLTRVDGDARGGAALSMRAVTGRPLKLLGVGEKLDDLEDFSARRVAGRILGMGDVVSLVEKAAAAVDQEEAEKLAARMMEGKFDLNDLLAQLRQIKRMGDIKGLMGMLPGIAKMKSQIEAANIDDSMIKRQEAIILSMTKAERANPDLLKASRKRRIAAGSGTSAQEINRLLKQHQQMADAMKQMKKLGNKGLMRGGLGALFGGGGAPALPPGGMPGIPAGGLGGGKMSPPAGLPGLGGGGPTLPGLGGPTLPGLGGGQSAAKPPGKLPGWFPGKR